MKPHDFCASHWVKHLARSLASLEKAEKKYCSELPITPPDESNRDKLIPLSFDSLSKNRRFLYHKVKSHKDSSCYRSLSSPLNAVKALLRKHPVLDQALGPFDDNDEFRIYIANSGNRISLDHIIAGLMNCAMKSDFDDVASRLQDLLKPERERQFTGYHGSIFRGLRLDEEIELSNGISIAPFDSNNKLIDPSSLKHVVWNLERFAQSGPLGVVLKSFQWEPVIVASGKKLESNIKWDKEFAKDAQTIVDLLAITHGVPVMNMIRIGFYVDPQVYELLGVADAGKTVSWNDVLPINYSVSDTPLSMEKFLEAKNMFSRLKNLYNDQNKYEFFISRLSSSLLRKDRFGPEDKILDVAIALELMYEIDDRRIGYNLRKRTSCFLEDNRQKRDEMCKKVKVFYSARSSVVHNDQKTAEKKKKNPEDYYQHISEQSDNGFDLARRTLFKLLQDGPPSDWNKLVSSGKSQ